MRLELQCGAYVDHISPYYYYYYYIEKKSVSLGQFQDGRWRELEMEGANLKSVIKTQSFLGSSMQQQW